MFPLTSNEAYIKSTGERSTLGKELGGGSYTLPTASADTKGGIKIGSGLKMTGEVLSADQVPAHTIAEAGKVLTVADDGSLEWDTKGAGGGDAFINLNFKKFGTRNIGYVDYDPASGAHFTQNNSFYQVASLGNNKLKNVSIFVDVGVTNLSSSGNHKRFIMGNNDNGFIYRNNSVWAIYAGDWVESEITDSHYFDNSTIKIYIDNDAKWHVYKGSTLVVELTSSGLSGSAINIGSTSDSIFDAYILGLRVYNGDYTE